MIRWRIGTDTYVLVKVISEIRIAMLAQAWLRAFNRKMGSLHNARTL